MLNSNDIEKGTLNAFEFVSRLTMGQLNPTISGEAKIRRETTCMCYGTSDNVIQRIIEELKLLKAAPNLKRTRNKM